MRRIMSKSPSRKKLSSKARRSGNRKASARVAAVGGGAAADAGVEDARAGKAKRCPPPRSYPPPRPRSWKVPGQKSHARDLRPTEAVVVAGDASRQRRQS